MITLANVDCFIIILTWGVFFFSYLKYKNKLIIDIFVTGILSGLVSITGDSKMFMIFYLLIFLWKNRPFSKSGHDTLCCTSKILHKHCFQLQLGLRLCANGRNIVDQKLPTLLDVTCCVRFHTLLHVAGRCCLLLRQVWNRSNFSANNSQHFFCSVIAKAFQDRWGHARSLRIVYKGLWVVSFPRRTVGANIVGSCCVRLHAALQPPKEELKTIG